MPLKFFAKYILVGVLVGSAASLWADVVETKGGARLTGTVESVGGGEVVLSTDYAGKLKIKQSEIVRIDTEKPIVVRLSGGTTMAGTLSTNEGGALVVNGQDGTITTKVDKVAASWAPGATDPAVEALRPKWSYQASVDITGKTGNSEELGTTLGFSTTRKSSDEVLKLYTAYKRQKTDGAKSADQFKLGFDYSHYVTQRASWYLRDEGGYDRVKDLDFYNTAALGLGYDMIKTPRQMLTGRAGLAYRFENYGNPATDDVSSPGLDFALIHDYRFENSKLHNGIEFIPSFDDFANYQVTHDSYYEIPLGAGFWKLRLGISNDYLSQPGLGVDKLDTTYYSRLLLNWGD